MHLPEENKPVNSENDEKHPGNDIETVTPQDDNLHPVPDESEDGKKEDNQG